MFPSPDHNSLVRIPKERVSDPMLCEGYNKDDLQHDGRYDSLSIRWVINQEGKDGGHHAIRFRAKVVSEYNQDMPKSKESSGA